ncbi:MAG: T9SS type A sorting domain-containing protein [Candidatus Delongbacteria bacterium]|nr:T9SS type A sorting domain-containing protein [Candidatus Delongbacteria bacterium]MBN2834741.1 T9SS type A sorting domain-containing protein [Candidatus Delongbacteria bacterium]
MKKLITCLLLAILTIPLYSSLEWQEDGVPIRQGVNIEWSRASANLSDGTMIYVWSDTRNGERDLFAQKISSDGSKLWGTEGIRINGAIDRQEDPVVIETNDGGAIIAWVDFRNNIDGDIYAQRVTTNGDLLWAVDGVELCMADDVQISLNIVSDDNNGAYVIWEDARNSSTFDIYGTHITQNGTVADGWDNDGNSIVNYTGAQIGHSFRKDGNGGAVVVWIDERDASDKRIYAQRMSSDGSMLWGDNGKPLVSIPGDNNSVKLIKTAGDNFVVCYRDRTNDANGDIYAVKFDNNSNDLWGDRRVVYADSSLQEKPRIEAADGENVLVIWEDARNNPEKRDIFIQKLDADGNRLWDQQGIVISDAVNDQKNPRTSSDGNGGAWIVWEDMSVNDTPFGDVYLQHIDTNGNNLLVANGVPVCEEINLQSSPLVSLNGNHVFAIWSDQRTGSVGLNYSIYDTNGVAQIDDNEVYFGLSGDASEMNSIKISDNKIAVFWSDSRSSSLAVKNYFQFLNGDGSVDFIEGGLKVTEDFINDQTSPALAYNNYYDKIIVGWSEMRDNFNKSFIQFIDLNGNMILDPNGIRLSQDETAQTNIKVSVNKFTNDDDYYAAWTSNNGDLMNLIVLVKGQKIDRNGNLLWGDNGIIIGDRPGDDILREVVVSENFILYLWQAEAGTGSKIYAKLLDKNGNTVSGWDANGNEVCNAAGNQINSNVLALENDRFLIWWENYISGEGSDIFCQIFNSDGTTQFDLSGKAIATADSDQKNSKVIEKNGKIIIAWDDFRMGNVDVYAKALNTDIENLWSSGEKGVVVQSGDQMNVTVEDDGNGYVFFYQNSSGDSPDLYMQVIDYQGNILTPTGGVVVSDAIRNQENPQAINLNDKNTVVLFTDSRSSGKTDIYSIYASKFHNDFVSIEESTITDDFSLVWAYPNPFNPETNLNFSLKNSEKISIDIYNSNGQFVKNVLKDKQCQLSNSVRIDLSEMNSGLYFYKINSEKSSFTGKIVLMK